MLVSRNGVHYELRILRLVRLAACGILLVLMLILGSVNGLFEHYCTISKVQSPQ